MTDRASLGYLAFYFAGGFFAMLTQTMMTLLFGSAPDAQVPNLGASGAIAGVGMICRLWCTQLATIRTPHHQQHPWSAGQSSACPASTARSAVMDTVEKGGEAHADYVARKRLMWPATPLGSSSHGTCPAPSTS